MVHRRIDRKKILRTIRADALFDFGAVQLALPGIGQRLVHVACDDQRVGGLPGLGFVLEKSKFQRQSVLMLLDKGIHAAGVGFHQRAGIFVHGSEIAIRGARKTESAELFVGFKRERAENLRELASRGPAHQIQLPEAVLRHNVALSFDGIHE